jgi:hypothetical protein
MERFLYGAQKARHAQSVILKCALRRAFPGEFDTQLGEQNCGTS